MCGLLLLTGCSGEADNGFCETHADEHWQHRAGAARMQLVYRDEGTLTVRLTVPAVGLGQDPANSVATLRQRPVADMVSVEGSHACTGQPATIEYRAAQLQAEYHLDCSARNKLDQLTVKVLDLLPGLEEVEVEMETPAVTKHFLVHRRCSAALYNFDKVPGGTQ